MKKTLLLATLATKNGGYQWENRPNNVHHSILVFLVIVLFIEAYGEWRVIERASTQDDFAVPDGWEAVVFTMDNVTQHILNQVFKGTVAWVGVFTIPISLSMANYCW
jgi:hypothetical protein